MSVTHDDLIIKFIEMQDQIRVLQETVKKLNDDIVLHKVNTADNHTMVRTDSENTNGSDISALSELTENLVFDVYKKAIKVSGNTLPYREKLRGKGGSWNRALGAWIFTQQKGIQLAMKMKEKYPDKVIVSDEIINKSNEYDSSD
jgi:hypothetical protein